MGISNGWIGCLACSVALQDFNAEERGYLASYIDRLCVHFLTYDSELAHPQFSIRMSLLCFVRYMISLTSFFPPVSVSVF